MCRLGFPAAGADRLVCCAGRLPIPAAFIGSPAEKSLAAQSGCGGMLWTGRLTPGILPRCVAGFAGCVRARRIEARSRQNRPIAIHDYDLPAAEFYAVINSLWPDFGSAARNYSVDREDFWAEMAKSWICDSDAVEDKAARYDTDIARHD